MPILFPRLHLILNRQLSFESRRVRTCLFAPLAENELVAPFKAGRNSGRSFHSNDSINN